MASSKGAIGTLGICWPDKSAGLPDLVASRRRKAVRGKDAEQQLKRRITWADLKFPPINLWVVATLSSDKSPQGSRKGTHTHRRQRPGLKQTNALHKHLHRRLESILAVRGGKR